jgi:hypothetical protein
MIDSPTLDWVQKLNSGKPVRENHIIHLWHSRRQTNSPNFQRDSLEERFFLARDAVCDRPQRLDIGEEGLKVELLDISVVLAGIIHERTSKTLKLL